LSRNDETRLVRAFRESRSEAAFRELFRTFSAGPYRVALRMLNERRDAEDALHDAWIRACEGIESFRGESSFSSWLVGICVNRCREILRTRAAPALAPPAAIRRGAGDQLQQ
jgi:RNA polymerase sigma-70 factor (ECF subfamily)